jgi:hypothetical protein
MSCNKTKNEVNNRNAVIKVVDSLVLNLEEANVIVVLPLHGYLDFGLKNTERIAQLLLELF